MTALGMIKEIKNREMQGHPDVIWMVLRDDHKFLLKAFQVMREMFIDKVAVEPINEFNTITGFEKATEIVDAEFERAMQS